jgi:hypothetical protein
VLNRNSAFDYPGLIRLIGYGLVVSIGPHGVIFPKQSGLLMKNLNVLVQFSLRVFLIHQRAWIDGWRKNRVDFLRVS